MGSRSTGLPEGLRSTKAMKSCRIVRDEMVSLSERPQNLSILSRDALILRQNQKILLSVTRQVGSLLLCTIHS